MTLPLCILSSSDDVQKLWRFANIIENGEERHINGLRHTRRHASNLTDELNEDCLNEDTFIEERFAQNNPKCCHKRGRNTSTEPQSNNEHADEESGESEDTTLRHSKGCVFNETPSDQNDNETLNYRNLETTIHHMNNKLQILEKKMDTILALVENKKS